MKKYVIFSIVLLLTFRGAYSALLHEYKIVLQAPCSSVADASAYTLGSIGGSVLYHLANKHDASCSGGDDALQLGVGSAAVTLGAQWAAHFFTTQTWIAHAVFPLMIGVEKICSQTMFSAGASAACAALVPLCGVVAVGMRKTYRYFKKEQKSE